MMSVELAYLHGAVCLWSVRAAFADPAQDESIGELIVKAADGLHTETKDQLDRLMVELIKAAQFETLEPSMPHRSLIEGSLAVLEGSANLEGAKDDANQYYRQFYAQIISPCRELDKKLSEAENEHDELDLSEEALELRGSSEAQNWLIRWNVCEQIVNGNIEDESYDLYLSKRSQQLME